MFVKGPPGPQRLQHSKYTRGFVVVSLVFVVVLAILSEKTWPRLPDYSLAAEESQALLPWKERNETLKDMVEYTR